MRVFLGVDVDSVKFVFIILLLSVALRPQKP